VTHHHFDHHGRHHADSPGQEEDTVRDQKFWDERYSAESRVWSGNPNVQLVSDTADLAAGAALDAGAGEGADALWLARQGWTVTAVDISPVALNRGAAQAAEAGADIADRIQWVPADLTTWAPAPAAYDLVSAQYLQLPTEQRIPLFARLAASVAPGGTLLIVGHHPSDMQTTVSRPSMPDLYFTAEEVAETLDPTQWDTVTETRPRTVTDATGHPTTIHDAVLRARRRR
jgi:SAM-dependent methyltransferase